MLSTSSYLGFGFPTIGLPELLVIGVLGLLIFGKRLPEVGRSLGRGIVQFKKGLREVESEVDVASMEEPATGPVKKAEQEKEAAKAAPAAKTDEAKTPGE